MTDDPFLADVLAAARGHPAWVRTSRDAATRLITPATTPDPYQDRL